MGWRNSFIYCYNHLEYAHLKMSDEKLTNHRIDMKSYFNRDNGFFWFFFNHGWWVYLLLILNENFGFALLEYILLRALEDSSWFIQAPFWLIASILVLILGFGLVPTLMGLGARIYKFLE